MAINIAKKELEQIFNLVSGKLGETKSENIAIEMEQYWFVPNDELGNTDVEELAFGLLSDDWKNLQKLLTDKQSITYLDFDRLAAILRAISTTISSSEEE
ncbi:MAG: hypothetical protein H0X33_00450 [Taibaiella sp.]|nr:hypothetical protein [Taibaiella sp.]